MFLRKQRKLAQKFQELHRSKELFVLPNIWNVGSAVVFEKEGHLAVATSSAGIAYDMGYPDGEDISLDDLVFMVSKITKRISLPLSVDFERGYAETPEGVKANALRLLEAGAVGFNLEDGCSDKSLSPIELQQAKIQALMELKKETGLDFVINARTCVYWNQLFDEDTRLKVALERGFAYEKAGADCFFVPGPVPQAAIQRLTESLSIPVNIILNPASGSISDLQELGVKRLSLGSGPVRTIYQQVIELAQETATHDFHRIQQASFTYDDANRYFR
ncbi:isocitrate lyase/PEP mutase family protein [Streptococcus panodentis]|uniref:Isocitrate lyase/phosphoenolpyruvate mutase family protein n=1 Tax=Streptococcus panodentis TaxID=1581472 RepID=A0ABS5AZ96_9STRE|nr:isocitrate lyase/phosphoenolpyruvate mutase family protein [Streptococcus panodentis]MBP2621019.1 isocitrate lyase/phosphoenolpyruvate mutase family protein [Streptococcus panodentis]